MPLETGSYIADLVASNPADTDAESQGAAHLRLIKSTIKATFPNWTDTSGTAGVGYLKATQAALDEAVLAVSGFGDTETYAVTLYATASGSTLGAQNGTLYTNGTDGGIGLQTFSSSTTAWQLYATATGVQIANALSVGGPITGPGSVPTGTLLMWPTATAPSSFLLCNGQSVSTTTYANLFAVLGYSYGGSGSSFNVPNFTGRAPVGVDSSNSLGTGVTSVGNQQGAASTTLNTNQLPAHNHTASTGVTINDPGHEHTITVSVGSTGNNSQLGAGYLGNNNNFPTNSATTGITASASTTVNNSPAATQNVPLVQPSMGVNFIIKI